VVVPYNPADEADNAALVGAPSTINPGADVLISGSAFDSGSWGNAVVKNPPFSFVNAITTFTYSAVAKGEIALSQIISHTKAFMPPKYQNNVDVSGVHKKKDRLFP
jgi:hypothetical protein